MSTQEDGGPAFPLATDGASVYMESGMKLRDYFAAHARPFSSTTKPNRIAKILGWPVPDIMNMSEWDTTLWQCRADAAYKYMQADAMLEAREKKI